jgi:hypothetical protein
MERSGRSFCSVVQDGTVDPQVGYLNYKTLFERRARSPDCMAVQRLRFRQGRRSDLRRGPKRPRTLVAVLQEFRIGKVEKIWQVVTARNPKEAIVENLTHFKAHAEAGENQKDGLRLFVAT